ncbi:MAG TPA: hypothetical protein VNW97_07520 [Candidatus Saccharimonadales bacterium]|jgi:hypothetical protein|nr:hypothetical protein [Candidatus Saccharimonadales bacterium]
MNLTNILWLAAPILQAGLAVILVRREAHRIFRVFFAYTLFAIFAETMLFVLRNDAVAFFYVRWSTEAIYALLGLAVLYEVFDHLFRHLYYLRGFKLLFPGTALVSLALSTLWIFLHGQTAPDPPLLIMIFALELAVRWLQTGLLVLIFFLAAYYAEYSQHRAFGIAAGFGISAFGLLVFTLVRSEFGTKYPALRHFLPPVAYLLAVAIWLFSFIRPEPPDYFAPLRGLDPRDLAERIKRWKELSKEKLPPWFDRKYSGSGSQ